MQRTDRISFANYLCLQRYAEKTQKAYLFTISDLSSFHQQSAADLTNEQIQDYLLYCIKDKKLEWSSCNIRFCALKKYYKDYLGYDDSRFSIPPRPRSRKLPMLLSPDEVQRILQAPISLKHRALLTTVYGSGLRVGEAVRLRPEHIESNRMQIRVEQAKGRKDRYTVLSGKCLELLRVYWRIYQPGEWLFFGKDKNKPMPVGTAQKAYHRAKEKAGINKGLEIIHLGTALPLTQWSRELRFLSLRDGWVTAQSGQHVSICILLLSNYERSSAPLIFRLKEVNNETAIRNCRHLQTVW